MNVSGNAKRNDGDSDSEEAVRSHMGVKKQKEDPSITPKLRVMDSGLEQAIIAPEDLAWWINKRMWSSSKSEFGAGPGVAKNSEIKQ